MASLQCPSCGNRHPIDIVPDTDTFACQECRRLLKVPDALRHRRVDAIVTQYTGTNGDAASGRISTLDPSTGSSAPATPAPARAGAPAPSAVAPTAERPAGSRSALAAAVEARTASPPAPTPSAAPLDVPQEILAPPLSPQASAALSTPGPARTDGVATAAPAVTPVIIAASADEDHVVVLPTDEETAAAPPRLGVHWTLRLLIWLAALAIAAVAVIVPYRRVGLIDFDGALKVIGGRGFDQWELPLIIVPPWAMGTALIAHFSIEGLGRLRRRSYERERDRQQVASAAVVEPG